MTRPTQAQIERIHEAWPEDGLEKVPRCPVCASEERSLVHKALYDWIFYCAPGRWRLFVCKACGSGYIDPRPNEETIHIAYGTYYTHGGPEEDKESALSWLRRLRRSLANGYINQVCGGDLQPANRLGSYLLPLMPRSRRALDRKFRYLLSRKRAETRLLDVGFGTGDFLGLARCLGWSVAGVDPDPRAVMNARAKGFEVLEGGIDALEDQLDSFDVITMSHVIEHVHEPLGILKHAFDLLKPGGILYLETPNIQALGHARFGRFWRGLEPPRHLLLFNQDSLKDLIRTAGFSQIKSFVTPSHYLGLAGQSRAIENRLDPYKSRKLKCVDRLEAMRLQIPGMLDPQRSEFLTVHAYKL